MPPLLTAKDVVEFATIEGAKDNRIDRKVGTLTPGKEADIIMLRTDQINVMPVNNAYGALVLSMDTSNVDTVFIAGRMVKSQGKLVGIDMVRITRLLNQSRLPGVEDGPEIVPAADPRKGNSRSDRAYQFTVLTWNFPPRNPRLKHVSLGR